MSNPYNPYAMSEDEVEEEDGAEKIYNDELDNEGLDDPEEEFKEEGL